MTLSIYKAKVDTPFGFFLVATETTADGAKEDILNAIADNMNCPLSMLKIGEIKKSNFTITKKMAQIDSCFFRGQCWGWIRRIK